MNMYNPPHPGEFIREVYLEPLEVSARAVAAKLKVSPSTFTRLLNGSSSVTPEMALRLSKTLGRSPESWLALQNNYDLWQLRNSLNIDEIEKLEFVP
jgi:addiction module HigA family antidote